MEIYFQVYTALLSENGRTVMLRQSSDVQSSLGKSSALFSSRVTKPVDVGNINSKRPSVGAKMAKPRNESSSKGLRKPAEDVTCDNDNTDVNPVHVDVL